jgi:hypothetical protein
MGIQVSNSLVHWNYFIALEQDLAKISRFIEFTEDNFGTYSIELAHLLLAASSEVDVVMKRLCKLKNTNKSHSNINDYKETITSSFPGFADEKVYIYRNGLALEAWSNWKGTENPIWWRSYNNVKHNRDAHFDKANLKNTINSLAGLGLVVIYYYREVFSQENAHTFKSTLDRLKPATSLIEFDESYTYDTLVIG